MNIWSTNIYPLRTGISVCELGCGTGVFGMIGLSNSSNVSSLTCTDGNTEAVALARYNHDKWMSLGLIPNHMTVNFNKLNWGVESDAKELCCQLNGGKLYDVVIGSELLYYRTDVTQLVQTVIALIKEEGGITHVSMLV